MEIIAIHSRLKDFQLLGSLSQVTETSICGTAGLDQGPMFVFLEAMAQLAAMHVRHLVGFKRHAFLLKVTHCQLPEAQGPQGQIQIQAELLNQSSDAFAYKIKAWGPGLEKITAKLLIGTQTYDGQFQKVHLQAYYQKRFKELSGRQPQSQNQKSKTIPKLCLPNATDSN